MPFDPWGFAVSVGASMVANRIDKAIDGYLEKNWRGRLEAACDEWASNLNGLGQSQTIISNLFDPGVREEGAATDARKRLTGLLVKRHPPTAEEFLDALVERWREVQACIPTSERQPFFDLAEMDARVKFGPLVDAFVEEIRVADGFHQKHVTQELAEIKELITSKLPASQVPTTTREGAPVLSGGPDEALNKVLRCRGLPQKDTIEELRNLKAQIEGFDLENYQSSKTWAYLLYWLARISIQKGDLKFGKKILRDINEECLPEDTSLEIIKAWQLAHEGDVDGALKITSSIETPDGRTACWSLLHDFKGKDQAFEWLETLKPFEADLLTPIGWRNICVFLMTEEHWFQAACLVQFIPKEFVESYPDLGYVLGIANAALLVPDIARPTLLSQQIFDPSLDFIEGTEAQKWRRRAERSLSAAERALRDLGQDGRADAAKEWLLWVQMSDATARKQAEPEIVEKLKVGATAVRFAGFAFGFQIKYDPSPLEKYLERKRLAGGLNEEEKIAELYKSRQFLSAEQIAEYLEQKELELSPILQPGSVTALKTLAYLESGQVARAKEELDRNSFKLAKFDQRRFRNLVEAELGKDQRTEFENLYRETESEADLHNLVRYLLKMEDWQGLRRYGRELYDLRRTSENALTNVRCLTRLGEHDAAAEFLDELADLRGESEDLQAEYAWTLYRAGRLDDAKSILADLVSKRNVQSDRQLDIQIVIQSGEWERIPALVERELALLDERDARFALQLATLAAETDISRSMEILRQVAEKSWDEPAILVGAYNLATRLGQEGITADWFGRARELSDDKGPIQAYSLQQLAEMAPTWREHSDKVHEGFLKGEVPLYMASSLLNVPLSRILISIPQKNQRQVDARRRVLIPIRSGGRGLKDASAVKHLGMDVPSLLICANLGLLEKVAQAFDTILVASGTLYSVFREVQEIRFHQPSRVAEAQQVRGYVNAQELKELTKPANPPRWLVEEIGGEIAELLASAMNSGGCVIHPLPIYKAGSLREELADLREFRTYIRTPMDACAFLELQGVADAETSSRIKDYLQRIRASLVTENTEFPNGPIYFDGLAIKYLESCDGLTAFFPLSQDLYVHSNIVSELDALIEESASADVVQRNLEKLRIWLRNSIRSSKVRLLPFAPNSAEEGDDKLEARNSLNDLLAHLEKLDAIWVEDRRIGAPPGVIHDRFKTPKETIGVFDVAHTLQVKGVISETEFFSINHKLRMFGYVFMPVLPNEFEWAISRSTYSKDPCLFVPSAELRSIRELWLRARCIDALQLPQEFTPLHILNLLASKHIAQAWGDESLTLEQVEGQATWLLESILQPQIEWCFAISQQFDEQHVMGMFAKMLEDLAYGIGVPSDRIRAYRVWFDRIVLFKYSSSKVDLFDLIAHRFGAVLSKYVEAEA